MNYSAKSFALGSAISFFIAAIYYFVVITGISEIYGEDPEKPKSTNADFQYYAVAYVKFQSGSNLSENPQTVARHGYFLVSNFSSSPFDIDKAIDVVKNGFDPTNTSPEYKNYKPYKEKIYQNFAEFKFWNKQKLYVYLDNSNVSFNLNTPLSFTKFGFRDNIAVGVPATKHPNYTFYNAIVKNNDKLLVVDNLFLDESGSMFPKGSMKITRLSINFNLLMCKSTSASCNYSTSGGVIPIVIDPDTGNGLGNRPI